MAMIKLLENIRAAGPRDDQEQDEARRALQEELREVRRQLESLDACFDMLTDGALLDSVIYERSGLMARYGYLLRKAKAQGTAKQGARLPV